MIDFHGWMFAYYSPIIIPVPNRCCRVSYTDMEGVTHTVEVPAASLYEAAALGVAKFLKSEFHEYHIGPATLLTVAVKEPETSHEIRFRKLQE